jgi:hypothetical protein
MPLSLDSPGQPRAGAAALPVEIAHALSHVTIGQAARLARDLGSAGDPAVWPPAVARQIARALDAALQCLSATPGRFIAAEDDVAHALAAARLAPDHVDRVLAALEDIYIARWG